MYSSKGGKSVCIYLSYVNIVRKAIKTREISFRMVPRYATNSRILSIFPLLKGLLCIIMLD